LRFVRPLRSGELRGRKRLHFQALHGQRWNGTRFDYQPGSMAGQRNVYWAMLQSRVQNRGPTEGVRMKLVVAVIKPFKLNEVREALLRLGVTGMTATEVKGYGRQKGFTELYRGAEYAATLLPKIKIEVAVPSELVDKTVEAIAKSANTGHIGDGKIFVMALDSAVRIRTAETNAAAL
jgi:nitrogen regulatory protein P-II 2